MSGAWPRSAGRRVVVPYNQKGGKEAKTFCVGRLKRADNIRPYGVMKSVGAATCRPSRLAPENMLIQKITPAEIPREFW